MRCKRARSTAVGAVEEEPPHPHITLATLPDLSCSFFASALAYGDPTHIRVFHILRWHGLVDNMHGSYPVPFAI